MPINPINTDMKLLSNTASPGQKVTGGNDERLKKACADFEAIFIQQILKSMRQTVLRSDLFGKGTERDIFESLLDQEWSKGLARRGMGLGNKLYRQMMKYGEANLFDSTQAPQINKRR